MDTPLRCDELQRSQSCVGRTSSAALGLIAHPEQLEIGVGEEKPAIGRALTGMGVRRTFQQTSFDEKGCLGAPSLQKINT